MPLPDGTNCELEDPSPPLGWTSREDITKKGRVVVYGFPPSPPTCKLRLYLERYGIPYKFKCGKAPGSYTKVPVLITCGRKVNDSYVILKHLIPAVTGVPFNEVWEKKITYEFQPGIDIEAFSDTADIVKFWRLMGIPTVVLGLLASRMSKFLVKHVRDGYPSARPSADVGKEFAAELGDKKFHNGLWPGQVDISYYGTLLPFVHTGTQAGLRHLEVTGLQAWYERMSAVMPRIWDKKNKFAQENGEEVN